MRGNQTSRTELWIWPTCAGLLALATGLLAAGIHPEPESLLARIAWPGDLDAAATLLQTIAASTITTATLTLTLTVVALQLASQQFSPRLLRGFLRDRVTKAVLATLVATMVFSVAVLRGLHHDRPVPALAMLVASALALAALAAVLVFINHLARLLRVDTMMLAVHDEASGAIDTFYPRYDDPRPRGPGELDVDDRDGRTVTAQRSGFVRAVAVDALLRDAAAADLLVRVDVRPGDHVVRGTPMAMTWARGAALQGDQAHSSVRSAVILGYERTIEQDAAFGFRQLTDIAVKALSPGINDPVTAAHSIGHVADLVVLLTGRRLGPTLHEDAHGVGRVVVPDRDLRYYLDLVCGQIRRYGDREPTVLMALLRMLRDVAVAARDEHQRHEVERQVELILDEVPQSMPDVDAAAVRDMADRVRRALAGDVTGSYADRSGETRSI